MNVDINSLYEFNYEKVPSKAPAFLKPNPRIHLLKDYDASGSQKLFDKFSIAAKEGKQLTGFDKYFYVLVKNDKNETICKINKGSIRNRLKINDAALDNIIKDGSITQDELESLAKNKLGAVVTDDITKHCDELKKLSKKRLDSHTTKEDPPIVKYINDKIPKHELDSVLNTTLLNEDYEGISKALGYSENFREISSSILMKAAKIYEGANMTNQALLYYSSLANSKSLEAAEAGLQAGDI